MHFNSFAFLFLGSDNSWKKEIRKAIKTRDKDGLKLHLENHRLSDPNSVYLYNLGIKIFNKLEKIDENRQLILSNIDSKFVYDVRDIESFNQGDLFRVIYSTLVSILLLLGNEYKDLQVTGKNSNISISITFNLITFFFI